MYYRMPSYYNQFNCIADKCPESCCVGWAIVIDDNSMNRYNSLPDKEREYVLSHIDNDEQCFTRRNGRCSFLNQQNLCDLIINCGEDKLCKTCKRYPRHFEEYGNLVEAALSLSCPEAARLILTNSDIDKNLVRRTDKASPHEKEVDYVLLGCLLEVRKHLFDIISDRSISIDERMRWMLRYGAKVQKPIYSYEKYGLRRKMKKAVATFMVGMDTVTKNDRYKYTSNTDRMNYEDRYKLMPQYIDMLLGLEAINSDWPDMMQELSVSLYQNLSMEQYAKCSDEFNLYMQDRQYEYEHILYYFIYTYFLGGVYDYNIQAMIKFAVAATLVIREMGLYSWLCSDKKYTEKAQIRSCSLFSRQIEHSDDNLMALEGILNVHPLFEDSNIIKLLV